MICGLTGGNYSRAIYYETKPDVTLVFRNKGYLMPCEDYYHFSGRFICRYNSVGSTFHRMIQNQIFLAFFWVNLTAKSHRIVPFKMSYFSWAVGHLLIVRKIESKNDQIYTRKCVKLIQMDQRKKNIERNQSQRHDI